MTDPRHALGIRAEEAAAAWLAGQGWSVLERRWRVPGGELDLVCRDPAGVLVGVEVKIRRSARAGSGAESVDGRRLRRLRAAMAAYARSSLTPRSGIRVDLISLAPGPGGEWQVAHLPGIDAW